jgi:hypothetical protein
MRLFWRAEALACGVTRESLRLRRWLLAEGSTRRSPRTADTWTMVRRLAMGAAIAAALAAPSYASAQPEVVGLYECTAGQRCAYGPLEESFPTYGNTYPGIGDCTFAAAADWEQVVLGIEPEPSNVVADFFQAGGTRTHGISQQELWTYWEEEGGIEGYRLSARQRLSVRRATPSRQRVASGAVPLREGRRS